MATTDHPHKLGPQANKTWVVPSSTGSHTQLQKTFAVKVHREPFRWDRRCSARVNKSKLINQAGDTRDQGYS